MGKILLDYFMPISQIDPTPAASTAFLKNVLFVCKPKGGATEDTITLCTSKAAVAAFTDSVEADEFFDGGLARVYVVASDTADIRDLIEASPNFFTIVFSAAYTDAEITATAATGTVTVTSYANLVSGTDDSVTIEGVTFTAQAGAVVAGETTFRAATDNDTTAASLAAQINAHATIGELVVATVVGAVVTITAAETGKAGNSIGLSYTDNDTNVGITLAGLSGGNLSGGDGLDVGSFEGVVGVSSTDDTFVAAQAAIANRVAFKTTSTNKAKNMCYAFGKLLSASTWRNQQYIDLPYDDEIDELGEAQTYFDENVSFAITDDEFGTTLGLFVCGGEAIIAPYVTKNLQIDMQSAGLTYVSGNQPPYTIKHAILVEDELQKVINSYIANQYIESGVATVSLTEGGNLTATGDINISKPNALWRLEVEMRQTL